MALYKRNKIYWIDINHNGRRIQRSTGTSDKIAAQEFHDKFKAELWRQSRLKSKPQKLWMEAAVRWIKESNHKKVLKLTNLIYDGLTHILKMSPLMRLIVISLKLLQMLKHLKALAMHV